MSNEEYIDMKNARRSVIMNHIDTYTGDLKVVDGMIHLAGVLEIPKERYDRMENKGRVLFRKYAEKLWEYITPAYASTRKFWIKRGDLINKQDTLDMSKNKMFRFLLFITYNFAIRYDDTDKFTEEMQYSIELYQYVLDTIFFVTQLNLPGMLVVRRVEDFSKWIEDYYGIVGDADPFAEICRKLIGHLITPILDGYKKDQSLL